MVRRIKSRTLSGGCATDQARAITSTIAETFEKSSSGLQTDTDLKIESVVFSSGAFSACLKEEREWKQTILA